MIKVTDKDIWIDGYLKTNLDGMIYDSKRDFDFCLIVTGDAGVGVGKSVLAQQIAYYFAYNLKRKFDSDSVVFSGEELMKKATTYPPSVFVYDEARAELDSKKALAHMSLILQDFFAECRVLNHIIILVLPDFFELNRRIAIGRSECLINVFIKKVRKHTKYGEVMTRERGRYFYYGKEKKRLLYLKGKKDNDNYDAVKSDFWGSFNNNWIVDREKYDKKKLDFLRRDRDIPHGRLAERQTRQRNALIVALNKKYKLNAYKIRDLMDEYGGLMTQQQIHNTIEEYALKTNNK